MDRRIEVLEQSLLAASKDTSPEMSAVLLRLLGSAEQPVRMTALHWLVRRPDVTEKTLVAGLTDKEADVRMVALGLLTELGLRVQADEIQKAQAEGDAAVGRLVRRLLATKK